MIRGLVGLGALAVFLAAAPAATQPASTIDWRADLDHLVEQLRIRHPDPFHDLSEREFDAHAAELSRRIGSLTDWQAAIELQRFLASLGEGHTALRFIQPEFGARGFPIRFQTYADGIFVQAVPREHAALAGARLIGIGDRPVEEATARIAGIVSADNAAGVRRQLPFLLSVNIVLHGLGLIAAPDEATYVLRRADGTVERLTLASMAVDQVEPLLNPGADLPSDPARVRARDGAEAPEPLWLKRHGDLYWFEYLPESRALYAQINRLYDRGAFDFGEFTRSVFEAFDAEGAERLVVDLRHNGGGDHIDLPFIHEIIRRPAFRERGRLFVLIGGATFSAAQTFVNHLAEHTNAIFVGEQTGQRPNMYGVVGSFTLPSSGLRVGHSRYYIQGADPADFRPGTLPDIAIAYSSDDYAENRDPALAAALAFRAEPLPDIVAEMSAQHESGGTEAAIAAYRRLQPLHFRQGISTERALNRLGYALMRDGDLDAALTIFRLNAEAYPHSPNVHDSLAEALAAAGRREEAIAAARASLAINPSNIDARRRLQGLQGEGGAAP